MEARGSLVPSPSTFVACGTKFAQNEAKLGGCENPGTKLKSHETTCTLQQLSHLSSSVSAGDMYEVGAERGKYYSVNVPLKDGIDDQSKSCEHHWLPWQQ